MLTISIKSFKSLLIKLLGGYTKKEYNRVEQKYQGLLDSKTNDTSIYIANEYMMRILQDLDRFARTELYGSVSESWASRMYNVIHNNLLRIMVRYVHSKCNCIYKLDTTLDSPNQFAGILKEEKSDELFILSNDDWEV